METNFESFHKYSEESFHEIQNTQFKAIAANSSFVQFQCRSPVGSVLIADPVLETTFRVGL